jgi:hypothetical protein
MRKLIALLLTLVMVFALVACGDSGSTNNDIPNKPGTVAEVTYENYAFDRSWPEETLKIGVVLFNPTDDTWLGVKAYFDYLAKIFNIDFIYSEAISSAEQEFAFIDSCAAAGCKGIFAYYNASGPSAIMNATSQGMYYVGITEYYDRFVDNEYYVGGYTFTDESGLSGDYTAGYALGYSLAMQDVKHIVYASGETKVAMFKERAQGFYDGVAAAQEDGSTAQFDPEVDVIGGWPDAPTFPSLQTAALTADYDAVGSATDIAYWLQPVEDAGKEMKMACIGTVSTSYKSYVEDGTISVIVYDAPEYVHGAPLIMLINACTGYSELAKNADGTPRLQHVYRWTVDSAELFNEIYEKHAAGEFYISAEETAMLLGGLNPNASLDLMDEIYDVTMEEAMGK